ncbi:unnamed protein product [Musa hybrid cultivar]
MVASVSAWAKPSAWALDVEEHESAMAVAKDRDDDVFSSVASQQQDFPSLAAAASSTSKKKKKKAQALTLAEFTTGKPVSHGAGGRPLSSSSKGLSRDELLLLPTGPRERSAEELERSSSRGFGYSSYGGARGRASVSGEDSGPTRWGSSRDSDDPRTDGFGGAGGGSNRDLLPSRADEIDDWGAAKKSVALERWERGGGGSFFDSQARADESDTWISSKSTAPPAEGRRIGGGGGGFEMFKREGSNSGGADSETWGRKKDFGDSDIWRREDEIGIGGRRRLVLQPRSLPLSNGEQVQGKQDEGSTMEKKSRGSNPFGQARPREEVLADKGQDWKQIDEKLEASKIQDAQLERSFDKRGFGVANGAGRSPENRTNGAWRRPDTAQASPSSILADCMTVVDYRLTRLRTQHWKTEIYTVFHAFPAMIHKPPTLASNMARLLFVLSSLVVSVSGALAATFTLTNNCDYTVWPGVLSSAGTAALSTTGFQLQKGESRSLDAPAAWSGRFWGRTRCATDSSGRFSCGTGDCGSGRVECSGGGAAPPATLAEFTLDGSGGMDFYDVSLVDGYNLPMLVVPQGGSGGSCSSTGCLVDLNGLCPSDLKVVLSTSDGGSESVACKSACEAFGSPQYCCSGDFGNPNTCKPSSYSHQKSSGSNPEEADISSSSNSTMVYIGGEQGSDATLTVPRLAALLLPILLAPLALHRGF